MEASKKRGRAAVTAGLIVVATVYAAVLIKIVLGKYGFSTGLRSWNLVPFRFVQNLLQADVSISVSLKNILGNFAIFLPLGVLAPALWKRIDSVKRAALFGLAVSAAFELVQLSFGLGAADVDDLLLNALGALCGGALYFRVLTRLFPARVRLNALLFLCLFGLCGVGALWLYAPSELPRIVKTRNIEALGELERQSFTLSTSVTAISEEKVTCRKSLSQPNGETEAAARIKGAYPLSDGAKLFFETISYQFSPNGNIQKTFLTYRAVGLAEVRALLAENENLFADLWLDGDGSCTAMVMTVYED